MFHCHRIMHGLIVPETEMYLVGIQLACRYLVVLELLHQVLPKGINVRLAREAPADENGAVVLRCKVPAMLCAGCARTCEVWLQSWRRSLKRPAGRPWSGLAWPASRRPLSAAASGPESPRPSSRQLPAAARGAPASIPAGMQRPLLVQVLLGQCETKKNKFEERKIWGRWKQHFFTDYAVSLLTILQCLL